MRLLPYAQVGQRRPWYSPDKGGKVLSRTIARGAVPHIAQALTAELRSVRRCAASAYRVLVLFRVDGVAWLRRCTSAVRAWRPGE